MSTDHQQYSIENQAAAIQAYATSHGITVIESYIDPGKSGLHAKNRPALNRLLQDVLGGRAQYKLILVYDVSRWGRFQDVDEAAHYEFVCKNAGVPVRYCCELFSPDDKFSNALPKALKRMLAAEYSRNLSVKVFNGQKYWVARGYKMGGRACYGLQRMLLPVDGSAPRLLAPGERKVIAAGHVILVPGPSEEVKVVQEIFRMARRKLRIVDIVLALNRQGVKRSGKEWTPCHVRRILQNPTYTGRYVWGRSTQRLGTVTSLVPREEWAIKEHALPPLVDEETYEIVQRRYNLPRTKKDNGMTGLTGHDRSELEVL